MHARRKEQTLISLSTDIKTRSRWVTHDVLELAGPPLDVREELFDLIFAELQQRDCKAHSKVRALRKVLQNQRD